MVSGTDYQKFCESLQDDVGCGPGENPIVLKRIRARLREIRSDPRATTYIFEKVQAVGEMFEIWFSPRRWNRNGDGGAAVRGTLHNDIEKLRRACEATFSPRS